VILCLTVLFGCATRDDVVTVYNRVLTLEKKHETLRSMMAGLQVRLEDADARLTRISDTSGADAQALREQAAQTRVLAQEIRSELAQVRGQLEETRHMLGGQGIETGPAGDSAAVGNLSEKLDRFSRRLVRVESFLGLEPQAGAPAPSQPSPGAGAAPPAGGQPAVKTDGDLYQRAKAALDAGNTGEARSLFGDFLDQFPKSDNADNARFWIGESYYQEKLFPKSILEYQKVIENHPDGNKVPAALLKQGMAFLELKDPGNARLMWNELLRRFPNSQEAAIARKKLESLGG